MMERLSQIVPASFLIVSAHTIGRKEYSTFVLAVTVKSKIDML